MNKHRSSTTIMLLIEELPFDILFLIFRFLTPVDLSGFAQTCRKLHDASSDVSVWIEQNSYLRTEYTSRNEDPPAVDALRKKVLREAAVDRQWRNEISTPTRVRKIKPQHPQGASIPVYESRILNGGDHVLFVFTDGSVDARSVKTGLCTLAPMESFGPCEISTTPLVFSQHQVFMFSEQNGYLILELVHAGHRHLQFYLMHADQDRVTFKPNGTLESDLLEVHSWSIFEQRFCSVSKYGDGSSYLKTCLCLMDVSTMEGKKSAMKFRFRFHLTASDVMTNHQCDLAMISPSRVLVAGPTPSICVYQIPPETQLVPDDASDHPPLPLYPIWSWKEKEAEIPRHPLCTLASYSIASGAPTCCVIEYATGVHLLRLSASGIPVREHRRFPVKFTGTWWIGHSRGLYVEDQETEALKISTVTFDDPIIIGSVNIVLEDDLRFTEDVSGCLSFDEETGRILVVASDKSDTLVFIVVDIA